MWVEDAVDGTVQVGEAVVGEDGAAAVVDEEERRAGGGERGEGGLD